MDHPLEILAIIASLFSKKHDHDCDPELFWLSVALATFIDIYINAQSSSCFHESVDKAGSLELLLWTSVAPNRTFPVAPVESGTECKFVADIGEDAAKRASPDSNIFFEAAKELFRMKVFAGVPPGLLTS